MSNPGTWEALAGLWPVEDRPEAYRNKAYINSLSLDTLLKVHECYEKKARELHTGGRHQADQKPATIHFKATTDNCFDKLCDARYFINSKFSLKAGEYNLTFAPPPPQGGGKKTKNQKSGKIIENL